MKKIYVFECVEEGTNFISLSKDEFLCPDCDDVCELLGESDASFLLPEVLEYIFEEGKEGGTFKVVYRDGKKKIVRVRKKKRPATSAQKAAAAKARKYAHTPEAEKKRRKSMMARRKAGAD
ncbi:MAG: hypothetical protein GX638_16185 [Crenarchaeota archaeon]|nr:hypothetical protein [Thermoproteota archaeon]